MACSIKLRIRILQLLPEAFYQNTRVKNLDAHHLQLDPLYILQTGGALGFFGETHPDLSIDIRHDHFSILIGQGDSQLVVALLYPMEAHSGDDGTVGHGVRGLGCSHRIEGS